MTTTTQRVALNADIVGYSRLMADDRDATTRAVDESHKIVETQVGASGGTLANFVGDSFMAIFDDAMEAMRAAIAITSSVAAINSGTGHRAFRFRMGLDSGDAVETAGGWHGDALNIAARIQAIASEGGIAVSGRVFQALDEPELRFRPLGSKHLKNIPEEVAVYRFVGLPAEGATLEHGSLGLEDPTVAVLPIHTETLDQAGASAAQLLREDIVHHLSQIPNLIVIDASGTNVPESAARYMLETGVHQIGDNFRIYSKLLDVSTVTVVSSNRWDTSAAEFLAMSDSVAMQTARTLQVELVVGEPSRFYFEFDDPDAISKIYRGWYHLTTGTLEGWIRATELFGEVVESHPDQPYGYTLLAFTYWSGAAEGLSRTPKEHLAEALKLAQTAERLDDPTGLSATVQAAVLLHQGSAQQAIDKLDSMDVKRPTCDITFAVEGSVRRYLGEWERSVDLLENAMRLSPVTRPWYPTVQACSLFMGGRFERAASTAEAVVEFQPNNLEALLVLAAAQVELGLDRRAEATVEKIRDRFPDVSASDWIDANPYQKQEMVDRWKGDLVSAGLIA